MADWFVEQGIGETRAALIDGDTILEAMIEPEGVLRPGTVLEARLVARLPERGQGIVAWADGEALLRPLPREVTEGGLLLVEIVREAAAPYASDHYFAPDIARATDAVRAGRYRTFAADLLPSA